MADTSKLISPIDNATFVNTLRSLSPQFAGTTADMTMNEFTERGFEAIVKSNRKFFSDLFNIGLAVVLQEVNFSKVKDLLANFGEVYSTKWGRYIQRIAINQVKPCSPGWLDLRNGDSVDPFIVNEPSGTERIFVSNFDFQIIVTVRNTELYRPMFISEFGFSEFLAALLVSINNQWTLQRYYNKLEAINSGINSTSYPLQPTQILEVEWDDTNLTDEMLTNYLLTIKRLVTDIETTPTSRAFNAARFETIQEVDRLRMIQKKGIRDLISVKLFTGAFHPENLSLPFNPDQVDNFGGLVPYAEDTYTTRLYPVYSERLGSVLGFVSTANATTANLIERKTKDNDSLYGYVIPYDTPIPETVIKNDDPAIETKVFYKDPNEDVLAIIADKGWLFENISNGYEVNTIFNPRGLYTNHIASAPNNTIAVDYLYNVWVIKKKSAAS